MSINESDHIRRIVSILKSGIPEEILALPEDSDERRKALNDFFPEWLESLETGDRDYLMRSIRHFTGEEHFIALLMKQINTEVFSSFTTRFGVTLPQVDRFNRMMK